jgi:hypothetical protein
MCDERQIHDLYAVAQQLRAWIRAEYARASSMERREELLKIRVELSRHLEDQARTFQELQKLRALHQTQYMCLLVSEASTLSGVVNDRLLRQIAEREVGAGRMKPTDELYVRVKAKLDVLCLVQPIPPHEVREAMAKGAEERPSSAYLSQISIG